MKSIGFEDIVDVMLNISDPNTGAAVSEVPGVSAPKINAGVSVYNVEGGGTGIAGWSTNVSWSASDNDTVSWSSGSIYLPDGTALAVSSGNTGNMSGTTYIYYDRETNTVTSSTSASASVGENKILLCVASPVSGSGKKAEFQAFGTNDQSTFIYASNIAANTITGNEIAANTITAAEIDAGAITTAKIDAGAVTASKITVGQLSDIDSDLGSITAGSITGVTITAGNANGTKVVLNPSSAGEIDFYYNGNFAGDIIGGTIDGNRAIRVDADYFGMSSGTMIAGGKLRIPVGNNLYN